MLILREAKAMAGSDHYALFIDKRIVVALLCWALGTVLLFFLVRGKARGWKRRLGTVLAAVAVSAVVAPVYLDESRYDSVENYAYLNRWAATQDYISHGFFYPFIHSITEMVETPPDGYSQEETEEILASYTDADVPEDRKVNVISLMREAYVDFSRYDIEGLDCSGYDLYHQLEAEGYVRSIPGKGSFASPHTGVDEARRQELFHAFDQAAAELLFLGVDGEALWARIRALEGGETS